MSSFTLKGTLTPKHRAARLELIEPDDHIVELRHGTEVIARFNSAWTTVQEIRKEADRWLALQEDKSQ